MASSSNFINAISLHVMRYMSQRLPRFRRGTITGQSGISVYKVHLSPTGETGAADGFDYPMLRAYTSTAVGSTGGPQTGDDVLILETTPGNPVVIGQLITKLGTAASSICPLVLTCDPPGGNVPTGTLGIGAWASKLPNTNYTYDGGNSWAQTLYALDANHEADIAIAFARDGSGVIGPSLYNLTADWTKTDANSHSPVISERTNGVGRFDGGTQTLSVSHTPVVDADVPWPAAFGTIRDGLTAVSTADDSFQWRSNNAWHKVTPGGGGGGGGAGTGAANYSLSTNWHGVSHSSLVTSYVPWDSLLNGNNVYLDPANTDGLTIPSDGGGDYLIHTSLRVDMHATPATFWSVEYSLTIEHYRGSTQLLYLREQDVYQQGADDDFWGDPHFTITGAVTGTQPGDVIKTSLTLSEAGSATGSDYVWSTPDSWITIAPLGGGGSVGGSDITMADGKNIIVGSTTGTKIGTATTQKLAFYGAAPIVQQINTAGAVTAGATYTASEQKMLTDAYTCLRNLGLLS
jgi:hypothetical protein